jgi:predicted lipoprotein with Yx(FWY)xxD motif
MKPPRNIAWACGAAVGVFAAFGLLAAGCSSPPADRDSQAISEVTPTHGAAVKIREVPRLGTILVNSRGMALYTNDVDTPDTLVCVGECADEWPPVVVSGRSVPATVQGVKGRFSLVTRPNGDKQLALNDHPLYTFDEDEKPGMVHGNGFVDTGSGGTKLTWHVATPTGVVIDGTHKPSPTKSPR